MATRLVLGRMAGLALAGLGAASLSVCGGGSGGGPTEPPVIATPAPTPTPGPTPEPPLSSSCTKLPAGSTTAKCERVGPDFQDAVDEAIRRLQGEQPQIFEGDHVLRVGAYYVGLIGILDEQGLCVTTDGEELGVARDATYSEQYDVLSSTDRARFGPASYQVTCTPSAVPAAAPGLPPQQAGCPLAPSRAVACGREPVGRYYPDVEAAIDQLLKEQPELFDFNDTSNQGYPRFLNVESYHKGIIDILSTKGYCGVADGEEIGLKRGSNEFNEQYDVDLQSKYVRRDPNSYRTSCYPAAF